ncbi:MAG: cytochrome c-type biogenesis CcmF C-terminal domain-containing protein, partial [Steroidobacteraceae bacterium]
IALAVVLGVYAGRHFLAVVGLALGIWIILSSAVDPIDRIRRRLTLSRGVLGMSLAHVGLGVAVIALSVVGPYTVERDIALGDGQSAQVGQYDFKLVSTKDVDGPNYSATRATVVVSRNGHPVTTLYPEKRLYWVRQQQGTHAGIKNEFGTDLFVSLGSDLGAGRWSMRAQIRPMITFLWLGPLLMAIGGFCAATDRRYRLARSAADGAEPGTQVAKESAA